MEPSSIRSRPRFQPRFHRKAWQDAGVHFRSLLPVAVVASVVLAAGCQHDVTVRSWPENAAVANEDGPISKTPATWTEDIGPDRPRVLSLQLGGLEREVVVDRSVISWPAVGVWTAAGAGACCALNAVGFGLWSILVASTRGENALFAPGVTMPVGALLFFGGASAGLLYGRQGPDEIMVDFEGGRVVSFPEGVATWNGEPPAPVPLSALLPEEDPASSLEATSEANAVVEDRAADVGDVTREPGVPERPESVNGEKIEGAGDANPGDVNPGDANPGDANPGATGDDTPSTADKLVDDEPPTRF